VSYFATDKIEPLGYFSAYVAIAGELGPAAKVCELGVYRGESLRMWQALFPLGQVIGVDISEGAVWPPGTVRIVAAQDDPGLPGLLGGQLNLVVDDASHDGGLTRRSFDLLWPLVAPGGYYVIEDWQVSLSDRFGSYGPGMLRCAESFLPLLRDRGGQVDEIRYRYGMIIVHRAAG
jgi:hypothetical protein